MHTCAVVVTSTIFPRPSRDPKVVRSVHTSEQRITQTKETLRSLRALGYERVWLVDNSGHQHEKELRMNFPDVNLQIYDHFQFNNKGISETILLLESLIHLPQDEPIMKISGRYTISKVFPLDFSRFDFNARIYWHSRNFRFKHKTMATRCYAVRDTSCFRIYLYGLLEEIYSQSARIVGFRSFIRLLSNQFRASWDEYDFSDPILSVEAASVEVLKRKGLRLGPVADIGLRGYAGTFQNLVITD